MAGIPAICLTLPIVHILIVVDELTLSQHLCEALQLVDIEVEFTQSTSIATSLCLINRFDCIIVSTSWKMLQWSRMIRSLQSTPIILFSFLNAVSDPLDSFDANDCAYLSEPFDLEQLVSILNTRFSSLIEQ